MSKEPEIYLTPAAQMKHIRDVVLGVEKESPDKAYQVLLDSFSRLDVLRNRISDLESKMVLKEQPFTSHAPVVSRLIVWVRTAWHWMSTKRYSLPLIQQQTAFNTQATQNLREIGVELESLTRTVREIQIQLEQASESRDSQTDAHL